MIQIQLILAFIKHYWKAMALTAILVGVALFVMSWHSRGLRLETALAKVEASDQRAQEWRDTAAECSRKTLDLMAENAEFQAKLTAALNRPPDVVIKYKDKIKVVTETVMSDDCPTAIGQMADVLATVPACEEDP